MNSFANDGADLGLKLHGPNIDETIAISIKKENTSSSVTDIFKKEVKKTDKVGVNKIHA